MIGIDSTAACSQGAMRQPGAETEGLRLRSAAAKFNGFCEKKLKRCASPRPATAGRYYSGGKEL